MQDSNLDRSRGAALDRIDSTEKGYKVALAGAALVEALMLTLFVVLADFSNRVHVLIFIGSCLVYVTLGLGMVALTDSLSQGGDGPHQLVDIHLLGVTWCSDRLEEIPVTAQTHQLAPETPIGVAVGPEVTPIHPTIVGTGGMRAEVARGLNLSGTTSGADHAGWRRAGHRRLRDNAWLTELALGLVGIPG
jgi:hypothetical protein